MKRARGEAFGKALILGEHAVVYGEPALCLGFKPGIRAWAMPWDREYSEMSIPAWGMKRRTGQGDLLAQALEVILERMNVRAVSIEVEPYIPPGVGLGSSAALSVAIIQALGNLQDRTLSFEEINAIAFETEKLFHGHPSGIDHTTAALGGVIKFQKGKPFEAIQVLTHGVHWLVAVVEKGASTKVMVEKVKQLRSRHSPWISSMMKLMGLSIDEAIEAWKEEDYAKLGEIMTLHHGCLRTLGVSSQRLDEGVEKAIESGAYGAKLTGAGGGGCILALVPEQALHSVQNAMRSISQNTLLLDL